MNTRIALKIYKHRYLSHRCFHYQQVRQCHGYDDCCEEYGDKQCRKCVWYDKEGERLNYSDAQIEKAEKIVRRRTSRLIQKQRKLDEKCPKP